MTKRRTLFWNIFFICYPAVLFPLLLLFWSRVLANSSFASFINSGGVMLATITFCTNSLSMLMYREDKDLIKFRLFAFNPETVLIVFLILSIVAYSIDNLVMVINATTKQNQLPDVISSYNNFWLNTTWTIICILSLIIYVSLLRKRMTDSKTPKAKRNEKAEQTAQNAKAYLG